MTNALVALHPGAAYLCETLEAPRYASLFDSLVRPEDLDDAELDRTRALLIPSRTNPERLRPHVERLIRFLGKGGIVVAMGETFQDTWIPGVTMHPLETNFWWWLEPGADLGMDVANAGHPLMRGCGKRDVTWHMHGWYETPAGSDVLIADAEGRAHMYADRASFGGHLVITSLDPCYHHGSHFMPATTRFLDRFLPNLRDWAMAA
jgi:hypothetical protein